MAEAVQGTRLAYSVGDLMLYIQPLTKVDSASTHASGLTNIVGYWANCTNQASASDKMGCDVAVSSGTFTFYLAENDRNLDLYILSGELE